jgi:YD repeat-containing protein
MQMRRPAFVLLAVASASVSLAHGQTITRVTREFYPATGLLKSETRDGVKTSYTYLAKGELDTVTDARGYVTQYSNYKLGIPRLEVRAKGKPEQVTIQREVSDIGCIVWEIDGENNKTTYGRDLLCRPTSITHAKIGSAVTAIVYSPYTVDTPETHTLTRGNFVQVSKYDGFGRLVERSSGGIKNTWGYDGLGRKKFESYPVEETVTAPTGKSFEYDALDRLSKVTHPDTKTAEYQFTVNAAGQPQTKITDERNNLVTHTFRAFGTPDTAELMAVSTSVAAADLLMKRNVRGQITEVVQGGFTRTYGYDARYYLTSIINPETGTTTYGRDAAGNMTSVQVGTSGITYFDVNGLGQVYGIRYPDSSKNVTQTWYKNGLHKSAVTSTSTLNWQFDANGKLTQESLTTGGHEFATSFEYDGNDRLKTIIYPKKGATLALAPDVFGRATKIGSYVAAIDYHPNGVAKSMTYGNGVKVAMTIDSRLRPDSISAGKGGGTGYTGMTMVYDGTSNLGTVTDTANSSNNRVFGYDGIDRLTNVNVGGTDYPVTYDGAGNIKKQTFGGALTYTYNTSTNRLSSTAGTKAATYAYDVRGNVSFDGTTSFTYDDNSRLRCAKCGTASQIDYDYTGTGVRLSRTKGGQTAYLVYGGTGDLLMEFNPSTNQRQEHIYFKGQKIASTTQSAYFATTLGLNVSAAAINPGQSVTLTATVSGGRTPDGVVDFYDNGVLIGTATIVNGKATFTTGALGFGYHNFTAGYEGDGANAVSSTAAATRVESGKVTATVMTIIDSLLLDD